MEYEPLKIVRYEIRYETAEGIIGTVSVGHAFVSFPTLAEARAFIRGLQYLDHPNDYIGLKPFPIYNQPM